LEGDFPFFLHRKKEKKKKKKKKKRERKAPQENSQLNERSSPFSFLSAPTTHVDYQTKSIWRR